VSDPSLTEFLYRTLRNDPPPILARVLPVLLSLGDTYAPRVLGDLLARLSPPDMSALVRELRDELRPAVVAVIWSLLREEDSNLQEALGEVLPGTVDPRAQQLLVSMVRRLRTGVGEGEPQGAEASMEREVLLSSEKETYRFEREHLRSCAVLFSDIQDYSRKAEELTPMEITSLLQEYEGILLPIVDAHEGTLVKRMGDGHIFVFDDPLCAVLAGIRVQKALRRFNRFRPEKMRVIIRIGIHWGEVVERAGDVFGNTVNIASRLQAAAMGGTTCISQGLFTMVADWIHANDLGMIRAKGLRDPIHTWEPTEVALGLPAELDPLRKSREASPAASAPAGGSSSFAPGSIDGMIKALGEAFQTLSALSRRSARGESEARVIDAAFSRAWQELQTIIAELAKPRQGP
jgi:class 3 adenylate cyclase